MAHSHSIKQYPGQMAGIIAFSAAVGAGIAMLVSPKSGAENRDKIKQYMNEMKTKAEQGKNSTTSKFKAKTDKSSSSSTSTQEETRQRKSATKTTAKRPVADSKDITDEIRRNGEP